MSEEKTFLGDFAIPLPRFEGIDYLFEAFRKEEFRHFLEKEKLERVNRVLYEYIANAKTPCFLLIPIVEFIERINQENILENYTFSQFELWLNQFSGLSFDENYSARGKIMGKLIPREDYQLYFPIGMGKIFPGSHFVTGHGSPDLDTTVASFWGWVDSFAARVSEGLHLWNVPGGPPKSVIEIVFLFNDFFGAGIFTHVAKTRTALGLSSLDLMSQKRIVKKLPQDSTLSVDHERTQNAVFVVDENGYFLGDWRNIDVEGVRQVIMLLNTCLRWFERNLNAGLISQFAKEHLSLKEFTTFLHAVFTLPIRKADPVAEYTEKQKKYLDQFLKVVLGLSHGMNGSFEQFAETMRKWNHHELHEFREHLLALERSQIFDKNGHLVENRPAIFNLLEKILIQLDQAIQRVRAYLDRLDIALHIKSAVFGYLPAQLSYRSELDEIRHKMGDFAYLTVTMQDKNNKLVPMGVVHSSDVNKSILGTVTLRDFCNREETKIPAYFEVISVIDHHKSFLNTSSPPVVMISDAQSSNGIVADLAFVINDQYSAGGMSIAEMEAQMRQVEKDLSTASQKRIMQRLLQKRLVAERKGSFFVDPAREYIEYLHFLYAILDDTDLLTKLSYRDLMTVASLLNRMKSISLRKEVEIIQFDDLQRDNFFVEAASKRILQDHDMYSLYRKTYQHKEIAVEENIRACVEEGSLELFSDTKQQNGCCRVGQAKLFPRNFNSFYRHAEQLRSVWYENAVTFCKDNPEFDLHMQMVSTISGAEDMYSGGPIEYDHKDEMWLWIPSTDTAIQHLKAFLNAFSTSPQVVKNSMEVEFPGDNAKELDQIFKESFLPIPRVKSGKKEDKKLPIAILRYHAGSINSRKAMISPYLPKLV